MSDCAAVAAAIEPSLFAAFIMAICSTNLYAVVSTFDCSFCCSVKSTVGATQLSSCGEAYICAV